MAELPVAEEAECHPLSPYGIDKRAGELFLRYHSLVHGVATQPLRFFNVYGPRQDPRSPYSGVISIFVDRGLAGRDLTIFGDGEQTRDFIFVGDVVRAVVGAALSDGGDGRAGQHRHRRQHTVNQLAAEVLRLCGSSAAIHHAAERAGENPPLGGAGDARRGAARLPRRDPWPRGCAGRSTGSAASELARAR